MLCKLVNPLTKHTSLVFGQIQDEFNTSRNKSSSLVLKPCKFAQETSEEVLFIKARQIYLLRSRQIQYLLRSMKSKFPDLIFSSCLCIYVRFLFSQPQTYIRLILEAFIYENTRRTHGKKKGDRVPYSLLKKLLHLCALGFCN